jgi:SAM-dependent methyltransferase
MFTVSAASYDLIYSSFKDYAAEAAKVAALVRDASPSCASILDVACGTGEHAKRLAEHGFAVDGVDLNPDFLHLARQKHPSGRFFEADMTAFSLPHRYDAVLCLFSSIGYLTTLDSVRAAFSRFREHLNEGGVVIVEPWYPPGVLDRDRVSENVGEAEGVRVTRTAHVEVDGRLSRLFFDYEIRDASGTHHAHEVHELGLFTTNELIDAFRQAGLAAVHDPKGLTDRGLFVATPR